MNSAVITLKSITEANKAKKQLSNYKIKCSVEKIHMERDGCGYGIRVHSDPGKVCRLLSTVNIECGETTREQTQGQIRGQVRGQGRRRR